LRPPPAALALAIAAMFLAILAAARPSIWRKTRQSSPLQVVLDCGRTMSASSHGSVRFRATADRLAEALCSESRDIPVQVRIAPGGDEKTVDSGELSKTVAALPLTGMDTAGSLSRAVERALQSADDMVFVVSDQPIASTDARVVRVAPEEGLDALWITKLAARESPRPQVMVSVLNESSQTTARLQIETVGQRERSTIELPPRGTSRDYFVSPPELGETIEASVTGAEAGGVENSAWLARDGRWGLIETHVPLDPAIERMLEVYARHRPTSAGSQTIAIVGNPADLADIQRGVIVPSSFADDGEQNRALEISDHPITRGINWGSLPLLPATDDVPPGFEPLIRVGDRTLLAVSETPVRKVWIGMATDQWAAQAQFVIFWSNLLDWIGQAGTQFASYPLEASMTDWQPMSGPAGFPGMYQRVDGTLRAFDAFDPPAKAVRMSTSNWKKRVSDAAAKHGGQSIAGPFALAALVCLLGVFLTWRKGPEIPGMPQPAVA
jgi:hypothetical protein